ncbi:UDP-2,4-diacetamido-2,4,6-trideoxy-beta-L-altropyranose hydrolase [Pseudomonas sp. Fig-3]|uniref:UDP-2,4-diacetamido-2,4, 6-trideoxy-beta-L-altropyranose hydrolase n=1 Tax=unclassified Pseudomonas TaxID=196821 RepID=UPI001111AD6C|nr:MULTISPECIES: UDP-2,4-diacetamido-2,4,6-trideoxy-beta-L-altropyranose hydrolase [unclassified Pseudomonas]TNB79524.1 UDP-2,4-diacetamido-2,4,6-trideoxy-beta-L-altropyranose hydrolase [Pseudomonas sp. Fig-3]
MVNKTTVAFRVDASLLIGSGHVMRCLTLADALRLEGAECHFICREHPGHLLDFIRGKGFNIHRLSTVDSTASSGGPVRQSVEPAHTHWLGVTQLQDAEACRKILENLKPDWLVVDHYALDAQWETSLQAFAPRLLVIDDLADRTHVCDLLLDQNLGHTERDYSTLVPNDCRLMVGPQYALLRPEFARLREQSLERRHSPELQHILITMGGVDQANATRVTLEALKTCPLPANCRISVVMGLKAPNLADVADAATNMPWSTEVLVNVTDMGERMVSADLVIGAAGATSWERCCLGVPTIMVVLADNQKSGAAALLSSGCVELIEQVRDIPKKLPAAIRALANERALTELSENARRICDGLGVQKVIKQMGDTNG